MTDGYLAGTASADITPPLNIPYLGLLPRQGQFAGIHDPLKARALFVNDGHSSAVLLTLDGIGIHVDLPGGDLRKNVFDRVANEVALQEAAFLVCSSHCHSAPETIGITSLHAVDGALEWLNALSGTLAECVVAAVRSAQRSELRIGQGSISSISSNRRVLGKDGILHKPPITIPQDEWVRPAPIDPEVPVVRIDFADGSHSVIFGFACHPTTVQVQPLVSADYPGVATALVEASPNCRECLFIQGACGDVNPIGGSSSADFDAMERYGTALGDEVLRVVDSVGADPPADSSPVAFELREVTFPRRDHPGISPLREEIVADLVKAMPPQAIDGGSDTSFDPVRAVTALQATRVKVEQLAEVARARDPVQTVMQALRIGQVGFAGIPGELFVSLGMELRRRSPAELTFCAGYANDWIGYLSDPDAFAEGGYETSVGPWCQVGPEGGRKAVSMALELLNSLWSPGW